jgi:hypothetical protein
MNSKKKKNRARLTLEERRITLEETFSAQNPSLFGQWISGQVRRGALTSLLLF